MSSRLVMARARNSTPETRSPYAWSQVRFPHRASALRFAGSRPDHLVGTVVVGGGALAGIIKMSV